MTNVDRIQSAEIILPEEQLSYLQRELVNVREDLVDNKYITEAKTVLRAGGLRSAIGSYWNAVSDDLRRKVMHRSLDLFNKEMSKNVKSYEDFQTHVTDNDLVEGAYKIGVLSWEAKKVVHQARETRNIFDGHPDSSDPSLFKVLNMIADCNKYVLSQEYPVPIINVNDYLLKMDSDGYDKNELAVEQAFIDLPEVYKDEMTNKIFTLYISDTISIRLRANIEFSFPVLWRVLPKEIRKKIGQRFDKLFLEGDGDKNKKSIELLSFVDGLRYLTTTTRRLIYEPQLKHLEGSLDDWGEEGKAVNKLAALGSLIPDDLVDRMVSALTLTFVGYRGSSYQFNRTAFFSNAAAPKITDMFEQFDNRSAEAFMKAIKENHTLKSRIKYPEQLRRLRTLGDILLNKPEIKGEPEKFMTLLVNESKTNEFYRIIS